MSRNAWVAIVRELQGFQDQENDARWRIGELVCRAVKVGINGQKSGAEATIRELAAEVGTYSYSSLRVYRTLFNSWVSDADGDERIKGVSWSAHRHVMKREDRSNLLRKLVRDVGDPTKVTMPHVKQEIERRDHRPDDKLDVGAPLLTYVDTVIKNLQAIDYIVRELGLPGEDDFRRGFFLRLEAAQAAVATAWTDAGQAKTASPTMPEAEQTTMFAEVRKLLLGGVVL